MRSDMSKTIMQLFFFRYFALSTGHMKVKMAKIQERTYRATDRLLSSTSIQSGGPSHRSILSLVFPINRKTSFFRSLLILFL
ncbi:hypothetical protein L6452_39656 [Arctium lappa]|uniref:Uncharacterized protein n=1 Tax=Arctium lappa TaxID=4217 RepID=A0ACB8XX19_ARCLA|nr:hypothetical protein L6452_39656 [Arctium lappa]